MSERNLHQDMTEAERRISNVALMARHRACPRAGAGRSHHHGLAALCDAACRARPNLASARAW